MLDQIVWLVFYDQRPADYVLEHVASTEEKARLWCEQHAQHPPTDLVTVAYYLDSPTLNLYGT